MTQILTSHAGSLPRSPELIAANAARPVGEDGLTPEPTEEFRQVLRQAVADVVAKQREIGIAVPNDGEYGHLMGSAVNYGSWWSYIFDRVSGLELTGADPFSSEPVRSEPGNVRLTTFPDRRDWTIFAEAYQDPTSGITVGTQPTFPAATGPIAYSEAGRELVGQDVANFRAALDASGYDSGFLAALSPGSGSRIVDEHYGDEDAFLDAWVEAMRPEYEAIAAAGLTVQIDDPSIAENWDQINPEPSIEDYVAFTRKRVDAVNRALVNVPTEQTRFHLCWGSWHGPHTTDIEFRHIVDLLLEIDARYYSFEAANVRHEHEWTVWQDVTLPEDKVIVPGIVPHAPNVVEHPELVAQRIERFARLVGPERVIASTDCGLGGRIHPQIAWAKLESLVAGAEIASARV
ncbi:cobalamin-independent methionine synthase II family protein [Brachybacterium sp. Marseille-Q2903]|uniref:Cobalamin-independent methionine synthase II family protein n=1 Tax=Brachybacterium epidermidis TaxID=2781983 RepID=A0ABR9W0Q3_9MICO|nr:cobalamin-independent methionine synthase II family protein [Brachybacterium epidermidis]MBE9404029.1 cobalamin-independent methionine synthase II family protein [Brachybacterium epidermidis]